MKAAQPGRSYEQSELRCMHADNRLILSTRVESPSSYFHWICCWFLLVYLLGCTIVLAQEKRTGQGLVIGEQNNCIEGCLQKEVGY